MKVPGELARAPHTEGEEENMLTASVWVLLK